MQIHGQSMPGFHLPLEDEPELALESAPSNFRILIVNEDMRSADSLKRTLQDLGYFTTFTAYSARRALAVAVDFLPAVALLDLELPDMTGYQLAHKFQSHLSRASKRPRAPLYTAVREPPPVPKNNEGENSLHKIIQSLVDDVMIPSLTRHNT